MGCSDELELGGIVELEELLDDDELEELLELDEDFDELLELLLELDDEELDDDELDDEPAEGELEPADEVLVSDDCEGTLP